MIDDILNGRQDFEVPNLPASRWEALRTQSDFDWMNSGLFQERYPVYQTMLTEVLKSNQ